MDSSNDITFAGRSRWHTLRYILGSLVALLLCALAYSVLNSYGMGWARSPRIFWVLGFIPTLLISQVDELLF